MMLAGPNHTGVYTVSINPSMTSHGVSQSAPLTVPALNIQAPTQPMLSPRPNAQPLVTTPGQLVNVTAVRSSPIVKSHACSYCQKSFSSRYNVNRHEKICKLNTNAPVAEVVVQQQLPQHNKESPAKMYMCHLCQKTFTSADSLNRHQKKCKDQRGIVGLPHSSSMGSGQQRRLHICKYCAKDFSTKWNVIRHERLFHKPGDPIVVPETILNGTIADVPIPAPVIGKPERYCRFCGNYFSSKYNAHRHEKICTRIKDGVEIQTSTHNPEDLQKPMQVMFSTAQSPPISLTLSSQTHQLQQHTPQRQQITQQQAQQQQQQQQITQQQQQQNLATQQQQQQQQQVQHQHTIQTVQGHQLLPQQTMLLIDPHHLQPFHVCKFCNKQMSTRCDAVDSQTLSNVQTVATVTGQHMQLPAGSSAQLTSLMAPVMASLPQVALVQPHGQLPMIQQQSHLQQQQQQQQVKPQQSQQTNQLQTSTRGQQGSQQQQQQQQQQQLALQQQLSLQQHQTQMSQGQQQITQLQPMQQVQTQNQQVQQPQQQIQQDQNQQQNFPHHQQQQQQANVERPHACRYCDKHFATKWYLDQHERIHTGEADMCKQCGKYFVTRWHLEKHMRVHLPGQARKMKKDSQTSSSSAVAVVSEQTSLPTEIKDLPFSQQMIIGSNTVVVSGDGQHIASSVSVSSTSESIRALSERPQSATYVLSADHTQYFLPGLGSGTPQSVAVVPSSASQEQDHNDQSQQASTIDKSQISITY